MNYLKELQNNPKENYFSFSNTMIYYNENNELAIMDNVNQSYKPSLTFSYPFQIDTLNNLEETQNDVYEDFKLMFIASNMGTMNKLTIEELEKKTQEKFISTISTIGKSIMFAKNMNELLYLIITSSKNTSNGVVGKSSFYYILESVFQNKNFLKMISNYDKRIIPDSKNIRLFVSDYACDDDKDTIPDMKKNNTNILILKNHLNYSKLKKETNNNLFHIILFENSTQLFGRDKIDKLAEWIAFAKDSKNPPIITDNSLNESEKYKWDCYIHFFSNSENRKIINEIISADRQFKSSKSFDRCDSDWSFNPFKLYMSVLNTKYSDSNRLLYKELNSSKSKFFITMLNLGKKALQYGIPKEGFINIDELIHQW
jgi:hypothetical protein